MKIEQKSVYRNFIRVFIAVLITVGMFLFIKPAEAQFYNGHQMSFGKNRVQYNDFFWQFYRFQRFDVYFYRRGRELAAYTARVAEEQLTEIENSFEYVLQNRIIFLVYNKLSDFRQSNIGLVTSEDQSNIGGVTQIIDNKVFLYYDGSIENFEKQIRAAITEVVFNEMLFAGNIKERVTNSTLLNLPEWYFKGLISYLTEDWNFDIDNRVKDGILSGKYEKFNRLSGEDAVYAGHSIWYYIADNYGESVIPTIIYMTRINRNPDVGFLYVLGYNTKELAKNWLEYYQKRYQNEVENQNPPPAEHLIRPKKQTTYQQAKISPDGRYIAYTTNQMGKIKIWLYDVVKDKKRSIYRIGHKLDQITDYSYPILTWHPTGKYLSFITEEEGKVMLSNYLPDTKELAQRPMLYFEKILDISFSPDGQKYAISGVYRGQTDIFVHTISANTNERITNDLADDLHPRFIDNSSKIIFSSNRLYDTIYVAEDENPIGAGGNREVREIPLRETHDLFIYDYAAQSEVLTRLTNTPYIDETNPYEIKENSYVYLSNRAGVINREIARFDSTISYIDTTTHYRYFSVAKPLTNYSRNIEEHSVNQENRTLTEILFYDNRYHIYKRPLTTDQPAGSTEWDELEATRFRENRTSRLRQDSIRQAEAEEAEREMENLMDTIEVQEFVNPDSLLVDINHYQFERERNPYNFALLADSMEVVEEVADTFLLPTPRVYTTAFYTNYLVNQVDFSFLSNSYQQFTGSAFYFNPGFNALFKIGTHDLFEDYRITGGFRFSVDFQSNEYLFSLENLKGRLDKQTIFHRTSINQEDAETFEKINTNQLMRVWSYPFNQVLSLKGTASLRYDQRIVKSIDLNSLQAKDSYEMWGGLKAELIFDNTRNIDVNIYNGSRFKIFGEFYNQLDKTKTDLFVVGADFRHYQRIHRNIIWASRFAASSSFGHSLLIYYLGGVDNWWYNITPNIDAFNDEIPIDDSKNYVYQSVATNMRGFNQNIRNGSNFAVLNNELRIPLIKYLVNRPMKSDFFNTFQIVGFFDAGTAWSGLTPYSGENAYDNDIIDNPPITITIDKNRPPVVYGYGFGLRGRVFGYYLRADWAWGIEGDVILPRIFYLSLNLDF